MIIVNDDLDTSYKALEDYVFGREVNNEAATIVPQATIEGKVEDGAMAVAETVEEKAEEVSAAVMENGD